MSGMGKCNSLFAFSEVCIIDWYHLLWQRLDLSAIPILHQCVVGWHLFHLVLIGAAHLFCVLVWITGEQLGDIILCSDFVRVVRVPEHSSNYVVHVIYRIIDVHVIFIRGWFGVQLELSKVRNGIIYKPPIHRISLLVVLEESKPVNYQYGIKRVGDSWVLHGIKLGVWPVQFVIYTHGGWEIFY